MHLQIAFFIVKEFIYTRSLGFNLFTFITHWASL